MSNNAPKTIKLGAEAEAERHERLRAKRAERETNAKYGRTVRPVGEYRERVQPGINSAKKIIFTFDGGICVHALFEKEGTEHEGTHMCHIKSQSKREDVTEPFNGVCGCGRFNKEHYNDIYSMALLKLGGERYRQTIGREADPEKGIDAIYFTRVVSRLPDGWVAEEWKRT